MAFSRRIAVVVFVACAGWGRLAAAAVEDPAKLVPASAIVYLAVEQPGPVLDAILAPEYYEKLSAYEPIGKALQSEKFEKFRQVVGLLELRLGVKWPQAVRDLLGGGVWLAHDPLTKANLLFVRPKNVELLQKLHDVMVELINADATNKGGDSPAKSKEYQGVTGWTFGPGEVHAIVDGLLVISDKNDGLKAVMDLRAAGGAKRLADVPEFQQARKQAAGSQTGGALAWGMLNLAAVRQLPKVGEALTGRSSNPLAEILVGSLKDAAARAKFVTAVARLENDEFRLRFEMPCAGSDVAATRRWCVSPSGGDGAPPVLAPRGVLASLSLYRDLSGMWMAREELFDEKTNAGFAQADTNLGLYFSGRDFGPEVLGELKPHWRFVAARREFSKSEPVPALKLPAFAAVLEVKNDDFAKQLLLTYQNIVAIINLQGIQSGRPQLLLTAEDYQGVQISKAAYMTGAKVEKEKARVEYNFNPSCVRVGSNFVVGSTIDIVKDLVNQLQGGKSAVEKSSAGSTSLSSTALNSGENTLLEIDGDQLRAAFEDNRDMLISRHMLSSGKNRQDAEKQIGMLFELGEMVRGASLRLTTGSDSVALEAAVKFAKP